MTTEYLRGEVLHLLNWAQRAGPWCSSTDRVWDALRREAESARIDDLSWVVERALAIAEVSCWNALTSDDAAAFRDRACLAAALYDFGTCSNLLPLGSGDSPPVDTTIWRKGNLP